MEKKQTAQSPFEDLSFWLLLATADFGCYEDVKKSEKKKEKMLKTP